MHSRIGLVGGIVAVAISIYLARRQIVSNKSPSTCPSSDPTTGKCTFWSENACRHGYLRHPVGANAPVCTFNSHNLQDVLRVGGILLIVMSVWLILEKKMYGKH